MFCNPRSDGACSQKYAKLFEDGGSQSKEARNLKMRGDTQRASLYRLSLVEVSPGEGAFWPEPQ
jgi:hypothetical protein